MRKVISIVLCMALVLGSASMAFALDISGESLVNKAKYLPSQLSLAQAIEIMQTKGSRAETAVINRQSDKAVAEGYSESSRSIKEQMDALSTMVGMGAVSPMEAAQLIPSSTEQKIIKMQRDFAKENVENNHQAELNAIEADTVELYYGLLQANENLKVSKDNLQVKKDILANVQKKFSLGVVAKVDIMSAESAVTQAEQSVREAEAAVAAASMNFNLLLGYNLQQKVVLTDELVKLPAPEITLEAAIASALENRLEPKAANFGVEAQSILLKSLTTRYPKNSATYMKQQVAFLQAEKSAKDAPLQIEMSIRIMYQDIMNKGMAVDVAQNTLANAREGYRIASITFDAGMNTLTDVQEAQVQVFQANQLVLKAITDYDLAIYDFNHAIGVGTTRLPL